MRRVHDLEMELGGIEFTRVVGDHGDRRVRRGADDLEARGQRGDAVAVAHPHRIFLADLPDTVGQRGRARDLHFGAAELAMMAGLDLAAELDRHRLLAIADAEHRHAGLEDRRRRQRRVLVEHRSRTAGQDDAFRLHLAKGGFGFLERHDFAIDFLFAHATGNELRDLRAEIDDQNLVVGLRICCAIAGSMGAAAPCRATEVMGTNQVLRTTKSWGQPRCWETTHDGARLNLLTKKPSVSVRRGVISKPSSEISTARPKR